MGALAAGNGRGSGGENRLVENPRQNGQHSIYVGFRQPSSSEISLRTGFVTRIPEVQEEISSAEPPPLPGPFPHAWPRRAPRRPGAAVPRGWTSSPGTPPPR